MSAYMVDTSTVTAMLAAGLGHTETGLIGNAHTNELTWWTTSMQSIREQLQGGDNYQQFRRKLGFDNADEVGQMLLTENVRSLNYRYDLDHDGEEKARELIDYTMLVEEYIYPPGAWVYRLTASDVYGCVQNFEYQACEHPEWENSEAHSFCLNLQHRLLQGLCKDSPWGLTHDDLEAKRTGGRVLSAMFDKRGEVVTAVIEPSEKPDLPPYGQPAAWEAPVGIQIWGARWIYPDDMVYNRQGFNEVYPDDRSLQDWLNAKQDNLNPIELAGHEAVALDRQGKIRNSSKEVVTLYEDDRGVIKGNPNGSYGYLYVAAWLKTNIEGDNA